MAKKTSIRIKPENKGKFNATKKRTGKTTEQLTHSSNPVTKKRAVFAQNATKWKKGQDGLTMEPENPYNWYKPTTQSPALPPPVTPILPDVKLSTLPGSTVPDKLSLTTPPDLLGYKGPKKKGLSKNPNYGNIILAGLLAADAIIPGESTPRPTLYPELSYNENAQGTGSQAIAEHGITVSKTGYKSTSKDKNKAKLRIPSNKITMQNVPIPVLGTDSLGNQQLMLPGNNYQFQGDYVDEIPLAQQGTTIERMKPEEIDYFNSFIDFVKQKGLQGSKKLNTGTLNEELYAEYQKANPSVALPLKDLTRRAQYEQHQQKEFDVNFAQRKQLPNAGALQEASISPIDDFFGAETSKRPIPKATLQAYHNNALVQTKDLGYVPTSINTPKTKQSKIPTGVKIEEVVDATGKKSRVYEDPQTGDLVPVTDMKYGGTMKKKKKGGYVAQDGVTILDENTVKFNGDKHSDPSGGIPIAYGGKNVMVEGDETGYISPIDQSLTVMGNMKNPITGRKFKSDSKILSEKEAKMDVLLDEGLQLVNKNNPMNKWQSLKFNAGKVMATGAYKKKQELLQSKEHLKSIQEAMLEMSYESGTTPEELFYGGNMKSYQRGGTIPEDNNSSVEEYISPRKKRNKPTKSLAQRHNNPGNIMYSDWEQEFGAERGEARYDGNGKLIGYFAKFPSVEQGQAAMKHLLTGKGYSNLTVEEASAKWTGEGSYKNIPEGIRKIKIKHLSPDQLVSALNTFTLGEDSKKYNWDRTKNPKPVDPYVVPTVGYTPIDERPIPPGQAKPPRQDYNPGDAITGVTPYNMPSNAEGLDFMQVVPELFALGQNKREPVFSQKYQPELFQPYQVSFQDRLNANQATFSAQQKAAAYNPSALATLGGQKYSADSAALADEFRTNQAIANDITNKNVALLNDAQTKNLSIGDLQYTRQEQAKSNTKAVNQGIVKSISSKILQNEANNKKLQLYENLYRFRFDPENNYQAYNAGPSGAEYINWGGDQASPGMGNSSISTRRNGSGAVTSTTVTSPPPTKTALDETRIQSLRQDNVNKLLNTGGKRKSSAVDFFSIYQP